MTLLGVWANWGSYAPVLLYLWFASAYGLAAFRTRRTQTRNQLAWLLRGMFGYLIWAVVLGLVLVYWLASSTPGFAMFWMIYVVLYSLIGIRTDLRRPQMWQPLGYDRLIDLLLFRAPVAALATNVTATLPDPKPTRRVNRSTYLLVLSVAVVLTVISYLGLSLRPCEWLDTATGYSGCLYSVTAKEHTAYAIKFSPDGSTLVAGGLGDPIRLYRATDGTVLHEYARVWGGKAEVSYSPDGSTLAGVTGVYTVSIWDNRTGELTRNLPTSPNSVEAVEFSPDGKYLAVAGNKSDIQLWRVNDWSIEKTLPIQSGLFRFSPDSQFIAGEIMTGTVALWRVADGSIFRTLPRYGGIRDLAYSRDGTSLAIASYIGAVQIWNVPAGRLDSTIPTLHPQSLAFSPNGQILLISDWRYPEPDQNVVSLWRSEEMEWKPLGRFVENQIGNIYSVDFSPDGQTFAYGQLDTLRVRRLPQ